MRIFVHLAKCLQDEDEKDGQEHVEVDLGLFAEHRQEAGSEESLPSHGAENPKLFVSGCQEDEVANKREMTHLARGRTSSRTIAISRYKKLAINVQTRLIVSIFSA